jgi:hypothetical protein
MRGSACSIERVAKVDSRTVQTVISYNFICSYRSFWGIIVLTVLLSKGEKAEETRGTLLRPIHRYSTANSQNSRALGYVLSAPTFLKETV